jgi:nicotinate-nucleotide pyrophosphorylase (carboxylating)
MDLDLLQVRKIVKRALMEDIGAGDITTGLTVPASAQASAEITAKEQGTIAGLPVAEVCFKIIDPGVRFTPLIADGATVNPGEVVAQVTGSARSILSSERVALNFLQRMSGITTLTSRLVKLVEGSSARIVDTRKTTPGLRILEKYAVRVGGGFNHRFGLDDGILIKDNHIVAAGGVGPAVRSAKAGAPHTLKVEVEVTTFEEIEQALQAGADVLLLDNMSPKQIRAAVELVNGRAALEASGGVTEETVAAIALAGVDLISVGALTHSAKAFDLSLNMVAQDTAG